ncbi:MAG: heme-binding domain-containing protein, partial [Ignavibacteriales bacterium]|nr:heme-binding domain-containing protein [Ignavibacteriales bacterium]
MKNFFAKKWVRISIITLLVIFAGIQFVPVTRENPPVTVQVKWDSNRTKELFTRGCMDCHSNETKWPWYTNVAHASW